MKLVKVSARNLKGLTFELDLGSISFLVGSNFAGKTARTDAIRLLLLGYLPELGKLPSATFGLCSGRELVVEGEFSDGTKMTRRWFLKGDAVKSEMSGAPSMICDEGLDNKFAVMLNAETYFALSERGRVDYVFANIPNLGADAQPSAILATVDEALALDKELDRDAAKRFGENFRTTLVVVEPATVESPQAFIEFAIEFSASAAKSSRVAAVTFEKTAQGLAHLRAAEVVDADLQSLDATRDRLARELEPLQTERARVIAAAEAARTNRSRREKLFGEIKARAAFEVQRDARAREIKEWTVARDEIPSNIAELWDQLRAEERDAVNAKNDHERQLREAVAAIESNERELAEVNAKTKCPYCGAVGEGWKTLKSGEIESALAGLRAKRAQLEEHLVLLRSHALTIATRANNARSMQQLRDGKEREIRTAQTALDFVEKQIAVLDGKAEELARIPAEDAKASEALEAAQAAINVKNADLHEIERKRKAAIGRSHDLKRLAEAEQARDAARLDEVVAKAAAKLFREQQAKIVEAAFGPLLATANAIFGEILRTPLAYREGEIGTWREGTWVGHGTFSGTEKALAYAAIQAALSARCPVRVMLVDELARLDDANATLLVRAVASAVERKAIDQFVGIDTGRSSLYATEGDIGGVALTLETIG